MIYTKHKDCLKRAWLYIFEVIPYIIQVSNCMDITVVWIKGIYNRLPLMMSYLLDIDLALWSLLLPLEVKFNKSWNTFFAIEIWHHIYNMYNLLLLFNVNYTMLCFYYNSIEIWFQLSLEIRWKKNAESWIQTRHLLVTKLTPNKAWAYWIYITYIIN